jgi:zinc/manganese transport system substrate-binding protein
MKSLARLLASMLFVATLGTLQATAQTRIPVIVSFSIISDLVRQIGGERVVVTSLVPANTDMHMFQPSPAHSRQLAGAKLVVINGLGLEGWADRLVKASGYGGARLVASKGVKALRGGGHGRYDPHAWQEVANVKIYVANIRDGLTTVDPEHKDAYAQRAADYLKQLEALEDEIKAALKDIPKPRRVITSHEAFSYYGDAYDIEFLAPQGVSGDAEPSAATVAQLIRQIKREKTSAIFVENINTRIIERIVRETGAKIGGTLYSDALSEASGPAATYIDMIRYNTRLISNALRNQAR